MKHLWIKQFSEKGVFYWKSMVLAVLLTSLPITVISAAYWYFGNQHLVQQFQLKNEEAVLDAAKQIDNQFGQLIQYAVQMVVKPHFKPTLSDMDFADRFEETNELLDVLSLVQNADPLIDQVYLYVDKQAKVLQPSLGARALESETELKQWQELMDFESGIFWTHQLVRPFRQGGSTHAIVMKLPFNGPKPYGAIVIYLNPSKLHLFSDTDKAATLLDNEGHVIGQSERAAQSPEALDEIRSSLTETEVDNGGPRGWELPLNGDTLLVNAVTFEKLGSSWTFVSGTSRSVITAPTQAYTHIILICFIVVLIAALVLSWYATRRIYNPIRRVMDMLAGWRKPEIVIRNELDYIESEWKQYQFANESLQSRLNQSLPTLREAFINRFVTGQSTHLTETELTSKLHSFDVDIEGKQFAAVVFRQHPLNEERAPLSDKDDDLLMYAAMNAVEELSERDADYVHTLVFDDCSFGVVLILSPLPSKDEGQKALHQLCEQYERALRDVLRLETTIVMNGPIDRWTDIPHALEQARRALRYRAFNAGSQLLEAEQVLSQPKLIDRGQFPIELEQDLIHALNMGLEEEAMQGLERFVAAMQAGGAAEWLVHQGLMRLMANIHRAMLQAGQNPYAVYDGARLYEELNELRDTKACLDWFQRKIIRPYIDSLGKSYNTTMKQLVENVLAHIENNFMCDLSLETVAADAGVSISQLSRAFKQMVGSSYVDYVKTLKINRAKEMLVQTDMMMSEIAEAIGYQPSYFNRTFKKLEGMTPGQYRQLHEQTEK
ncbi:helix-turn-helix domain-containing protein [Paenibacillus faecalis]|uniref:helix-turn-helix domain-containing protein n=1 Tax=Paenibacillus faecalis TaxID=2079532 RepID=UPI000D0F7435|nr:helix-turn-helix domain-containing protein [Paenibacillus faecalis]